MTAARHLLHRRRRGAILLVVLALLALFAVIGLSFVLYAESEATSSRIYREAASQGTPIEVLQRDAASRAVGQITYGTVDPQSGFNGHDLARLMYGFDPSGTNDVPYNGIGLVHERLALPGDNSNPPFDRAEVLNFGLARLAPAAPFFRVDPEHTSGNGTVRQGTAALDTSAAAYNAMVFIPKNAPYTYPDRNNALVAAVDPNTGRVIVPSGHRPSLFGANLAPAVNPNWYAARGRLRTLRPRPIEHVASSGTLSQANMIAELSAAGITWPIPDGFPQVAQANAIVGKYAQFPYPPANADGTVTGDVQNLRYADGGQRNDSFWTDPHLPTQEYKGRRLAPLVAPILVPLDGRLNVNAVANLVAGQHRSAAGFGPHEANPAWLSALVTGANPTTPFGPQPAQAQTNFNQLTQARFGGGTATPATPANVTSHQFHPAGSGLGLPAPSYAEVPWDGVATGTPTYPTATTSVPDFTTGGYTALAAAAANNPTLWNPYLRAAAATSDPNPTGPQAYPLSDLMLFGGTYSGRASDYQSRTFLANDRRSQAPPAGGFAAFQQEFLGNGSTFLGSQGTGPGSPGNRTRALVTPISNTFARPGLPPNFLTGTTPLQLSPVPPGQVALPGFAGGTLPTVSISGDTITPLGASANDPAQLANRAFPDNRPPLDATARNRVAQNLRATLSSVDVNRPLADYRTDVTQPLSNTNAGNSTAATTDRQNLAKDIFLRLAVATGARVAYDPNLPDVPAAPTDSYYGKYRLPQPAGPGAYTIAVTGYTDPGTTVTQADYDALRWLAQLAANMVDLIDPDDVSTPFVWNPLDATNPFNTAAGANSFDPAGGPSPLSQRVVFGAEKPRLVLNEVYAEIANERTDAVRTPAGPATSPMQVRFWVELLNPGSREPDPTPGQPVHPLAQPLSTTVGGAGTPNFYGAVPLHFGPENNSCYRLVVTDNGNNVRTDLANPVNVRGDLITTPGDVKLVTTLENLATADAQNSAVAVEPNGGQTAAGTPGTAGNRFGFAVVGPDYHQATDTTAFNPDPNAGSFQLMLRKLNPATPTPTLNQNPPVINQATPPTATALNQLYYDAIPDGGKTAAAMSEAELDAWKTKYTKAGQKHGVLLQRLANPYLAFDPNTNPYLTVDYSSRVEVQDGVRYVAGGTGNRSMPVPARNTRPSIGRVQPYAGDEGDTTSLADLTGAAVSQSLTLPQAAGLNSGGAQTTLFGLNNPNTTTGTPATPFQWLAHFDRRLVNPLELLHAATCKPHELTHRFGQPNADPMVNGGGPLFHRHDLLHRRPNLTTPPSATNPEGPLYSSDGTRVASPLYRALDLLAVKPWGVGLPVGGRVPGKVNLNMLWDEGPTGRSRVFDALLDKQAGNGFTDSGGTNDLTTIWTALKASRSPNFTTGAGGNAPDGFRPDGTPTPAWVGVTADEDSAAASKDRPFKGFGTALLGPGGSGAFASLPAGGGLEDTLLRLRPADSRPLFSTAAATAHPYQDLEPLRKVLNSVTTVSDTYVLVLTVGFFEVREELPATTTEPATRVLGAEAFDQSPGDLRAQFAAVLDRTGLTTPVRIGTQTTAFTNPTDAGPWVLEVTDRATVVPPANSFNALRVRFPLPTTAYSTAATNADTDTANYPGFFYLNPVTLGPNAGDKAGYALTDSYDGRTVALNGTTVRTGGGASNAATFPDSSRFFVGTGDARQLLEAYYNLDEPSSRWSYNPTTGELKVCVKRFDPAGPAYGLIDSVTRPPTGGDALTNASFGNPGPQPARQFRIGQSDPVVRLFAELK